MSEIQWFLVTEFPRIFDFIKQWAAYIYIYILIMIKVSKMKNVTLQALNKREYRDKRKEEESK